MGSLVGVAKAGTRRGFESLYNETLGAVVFKSEAPAASEPNVLSKAEWEERTPWWSAVVSPVTTMDSVYRFLG